MPPVGNFGIVIGESPLMAHLNKQLNKSKWLKWLVVKEALQRIMAGRTVITIAHRLSTVMNAGKRAPSGLMLAFLAEI